MVPPATTRVAERLYYNDPTLTFEATVTEIQLVAHEHDAAGGKVQLWRVALDRTAFYPESGGQPYDTGRLIATARSGARLEVPVERVEEDAEGQVWHFVRKPLPEETSVRGEVDAGRRLDHVQQHSGQHLLSAVLLTRYGLGTSSFHLGAEVSSIELTGVQGAVQFSGEQDLAEAEDAVNRLIAENRALRIHMRSQVEAEAMLARGDLQKLPKRDGPFRVIEMEGVEWNACGGTHVRSTGEIGCVLLRRLEKVRDGFRLEFVCGLRAVQRSRAEFLMLQRGAHLLGAGWEQLHDRLQAVLVQQKAAGKRAEVAEAELAEVLARQMLNREQDGVPSEIFEQRDMTFVRHVTSAIAAAGRSAVLGAHKEGQAWVSLSTAGSPGVHAGELMRATAAERGLRGGGGVTLAQAACSPAELPGFVSGLFKKLAGET